MLTTMYNPLFYSRLPACPSSIALKIQMLQGRAPPTIKKLLNETGKDQHLDSSALDSLRALAHATGLVKHRDVRKNQGRTIGLWTASRFISIAGCILQPTRRSIARTITTPATTRQYSYFWSQEPNALRISASNLPFNPQL